MAVEHMALVFQASELDSAEKLLLLAYANYTDAHGYCWPGVERLAADTGSSKRTVIRTRKALEAKNLLRHQRRTTADGRQSTNLYRINLDKLRALRRTLTDFDDDALGLEFEDDPQPQTPADLPKCQSDTPPWQSDTHGGGNLAPPPWQSDTQSVIDPSEDPSRPDAREADETDGAHSGPEPTETDREQATAIVSDVSLTPIDARHSQVTQIRDAVAATLTAGYSPGAVLNYLQHKVHEANTVRYVLNAFAPDRLGDIAESAPARSHSRPALPTCQHCGARDGDPKGVRTIDHADGGTARCRQCHPDIAPPENT